MICSIIGLIIEVITLVTMVVALILGQDIFIGEIILTKVFILYIIVTTSKSL